MSAEDLSPDRTILLFGEINEFTSRAAVNAIMRYSYENSGMPIFMYINSPGGSVYSMWSIIDVMKSVQTPIFTIGLGATMSAATLILAAGEKEWRFLSPHTRVMIHNIQGGVDGTADDVKRDARELELLEQQYVEELSKITSKSVKQIQEDIKATKYMSPKEAIAYGIADHCRIVLPSELRSAPYMELFIADPPEPKTDKKKGKTDATKNAAAKRSK